MAFYLETPFVDAKNCSEEIKNTLCDSGKAFYKESIIVTNQMRSTEAPCMHCAGHFTQPADPPACLLLFLAVLGAVPGEGEGLHPLPTCGATVQGCSDDSR